jgi:hypothetical protein
MLVGINYPWIDYGWDFGETPPARVAGENLSAWRELKRKRIKKDFRRFALQGIFAVLVIYGFPVLPHSKQHRQKCQSDLIDERYEVRNHKIS